jgi:hypothetical protein
MSIPLAYRCILDQEKRRAVIAMVANGSSRRVAARYVGCAPSTLTRTASRDPEFGAQLARAEHLAELNLLRSIQAAGKLPKHWRAAAWLLERRNPHDFGEHSPKTLTDKQVADMIDQMVEVLHKDVPEENYVSALKKLDELMAECDSLRRPIVVEPRDDAPDCHQPWDDDPPDEKWEPNIDDLGKTPDPLHLNRATNHPEVQIDLRTDDEDATQWPATTFAESERPSQEKSS